MLTDENISIHEAIDRLRPHAVEPERVAMNRGVQFPTTQGRVLALEQELMRVRLALNEAINLLDFTIGNKRHFGPGREEL